MEKDKEELFKEIDKYYSRERIIVTEMNKLVESGYIDGRTGKNVINGYNEYTRDQIVNIEKSAKARNRQPLNPRKYREVPQQKMNLEGRSRHIPPTKSLEETSRPEEPIFKEKSSEEIRERNLQFILVAGVVLLFLAGAVLATTSWLLLSPMMKVGLISLIAIVFYGMSKLANVLKIPETTKAFLVLSGLFVPFPFVSAAYYHLFGSFLSLDGAGRFILGFILSVSFAVLYRFVGKKNQLSVMNLLSMVLTYSSFLFFIRIFLPPSPFQGIALIVGILLFNGQKTTIHEGLFSEISDTIWNRYCVVVNLLTMLLAVVSIRLDLASVLLLCLLVVFSLQRASDALKNQRGWIFVSDLLIAVIYGFTTYLLGNKYHPSVALLGGFIVISYSMLRSYLKEKTDLDQAMTGLKQSYYYQLIVLFSLTFLASNQIVDHFTNSMLLLNNLFLLVSIAWYVYKEPTRSKWFVLGVIGYVLSVQLVLLLPLTLSWQARTLFIILFSLVNLVVMKSSWASVTVPLVISTGLIYLFFYQGYYTMNSVLPLVEQSAWHLVLWGTFLHICLRNQSFNQNFSALLPLGFVLALGPAVMDNGEYLWSFFSISVLLYIMAHFLSRVFSTTFIFVSYVMSLLFSLGSILAVILSTGMTESNWSYLLVLSYGIYLLIVLGKYFGHGVFYQGASFLLLVTFFYPLKLIELSKIGHMIYLNGGLLLFYGLYKIISFYRIQWFGSLTIKWIIYVLWLSSIIQAILLFGEPLSFLGLLLPMILTIIYYLNSPSRVFKSGAVLVGSYLLLFMSELFITRTLNLNSPDNWLLFMITTLLVVGTLVLKSQRMFMWPAGIFNLGVTAVIFISTFHDALGIEPKLMLGNVLLLVFCMIYLYVLNAHQPTQWSFFIGLNYSFLLLYPKGLSNDWVLPSLVLLVMILSLSFAFIQKQSILTEYALRMNILIFVQVSGLVELGILQVPRELMLFLVLIISFVLGNYEKEILIRRIEKSIGFLMISCLSISGLVRFLGPINPSFTQLALFIIILVTISGIARFVWWNQPIAQGLEWIVSGLILVWYLLGSLFSLDLRFSLYGAVFALILVLVGYFVRYTAYFINGLVYLVLFILYSQRHFWAEIPWWVYLAIGGLLLIIWGSLSELRKRNRKEGQQKIVQKVKNYFKDWQ